MDGSLLAPLMNSSSDSLPAEGGGGHTAQPGGHHPIASAHRTGDLPARTADSHLPGMSTPGVCSHLRERAEPLRLPGLPPATPADVSHLISARAAPSKTPGFSHETFPLIPSISHLPSLLVSICRKIFSVLFSGVDSSSGMFITEETIL